MAVLVATPAACTTATRAATIATKLPAVTPAILVHRRHVRMFRRVQARLTALVLLVRSPVRLPPVRVATRQGVDHELLRWCTDWFYSLPTSGTYLGKIPDMGLTAILGFRRIPLTQGDK